jgi:hypothetical protein
MGENKVKDSVPLLMGSNFSQWVRRMGCFLVSKDLEHVVGFDLESFAPSAKAPTIDANLKKLDRKAKAIIELHLSDTILVMAQTAALKFEFFHS